MTISKLPSCEATTTVLLLEREELKVAEVVAIGSVFMNERVGGISMRSHDRVRRFSFHVYLPFELFILDLSDWFISDLYRRL